MLREYQQRAITETYQWLTARNGNPCIVMPTGSGKSHVIAGFCKDIIAKWPESKIIVLAHVKELLEQNAEKIRNAWPEAPLGIYSAGMNKREINTVTIAGIQSVRDKAELFGRVDLVIVDEAHMIKVSQTGSYRKFIKTLKAINPDLRVIGLTATPYRLDNGLITKGKTALFSEPMIEPVSIDDLVNNLHYLSPLKSKHTDTEFDIDGVRRHGGDFVESELQKALDIAEKNKAIVSELIARAGNRKAWLLFCTGVKHAQNVCGELQRQGITAACVTGDTPGKERKQILDDFRAGKIRAVTNANVLTTGFDYPAIDLIAFLRPTLSTGLYVQMAGRGMRLAKGKKDCLVFDYAGNVLRHGPITEVTPHKSAQGDGDGKAPAKECKCCGEKVHAAARVCPFCGYRFEREEVPELVLHKDVDIMGREIKKLTVRTWHWSVRNSRNGNLPMLFVQYFPMEFTAEPVSEFIKLCHSGYAGEKDLKTMYNIIARSGADLALDGEINGYDLINYARIMNHAKAPTSITYTKDKYYHISRRQWS